MVFPLLKKSHFNKSEILLHNSHRFIFFCCWLLNFFCGWCKILHDEKSWGFSSMHIYIAHYCHIRVYVSSKMDGHPGQAESPVLHWVLNKPSSAGYIRHMSGEIWGLTHWGWDKMAAIFQTAFSNTFSWMKIYEFRLRFHWGLGSNEQYFSIGSDNGLVLVMQQAIIWSNDG